MHLVMFDVDGTLVDSAGFDTALYVEAVRRVLNVEIDSDWNAYEHVSDSGILAQVLRDARPEGEHATLAARVQERFVALVRDHLRRAPPGAVREIAGAKRLLERLLGLPNVRVGVAGGWEPSAAASRTRSRLPICVIRRRSFRDSGWSTSRWRLERERG